MTTRILIFVSVLIMGIAGLNAQRSIRLQSIPYELKLENNVQSVNIHSAESWSVVSPARSNLFISPDGGLRVNTSTNYLFQPDSDFIFTSKIIPEFKAKWDAGVLLVYNDAEHYAKFCFEMDYTGQPRIVTVVCNDVADDCNSAPVADAFVYYRITGSAKGNVFGFYYSHTGKDWYLIRTFKLGKTDNLRVGFSAQSPVGEGCKVEFSNVSLQQRKIVSFWKGE